MTVESFDDLFPTRPDRWWEDHREFSRALAEWWNTRPTNDWAAWTEIPLDSGQRADVFGLAKTYRLRTIICEVKVSFTDFSSDVRSGKFLGYLDYCNQFYFASPTGVISRTELPPGVGLITYNPAKKSWTVSRTSRIHNTTLELSQAQWQRLLWRGLEHGREGRNLYRRLRMIENEKRRGYSRRFGAETARELRQSKETVRVSETIFDAVERLTGKRPHGLGDALFNLEYSTALRPVITKHRMAIADAMIDLMRGEFEYRFLRDDERAARLRYLSELIETGKLPKLDREGLVEWPEGIR